MTDRKHPTPAFWITGALVAVLVGYPLSTGPVNWLCVYLRKSDHTSAAQFIFDVKVPLYAPLRWCRDNGPKPVTDAYWWYLGLWVEVDPP